MDWEKIELKLHGVIMGLAIKWVTATDLFERDLAYKMALGAVNAWFALACSQESAETIQAAWEADKEYNAMLGLGTDKGVII